MESVDARSGKVHEAKLRGALQEPVDGFVFEFHFYQFRDQAAPREGLYDFVLTSDSVPMLGEHGRHGGQTGACTCPSPPSSLQA
jgi:hypothetical protein